MKRIVTISLILVMSLTAFLSCGDNAEKTVVNDEIKVPAPYGYADELVGCWVREGEGFIEVMQLLSNGTVLRKWYTYDEVSADWETDDSIESWYSEVGGFIFFNEYNFGNYTLVDKDTLVFEHKENPATFKRYEGNISDIVELHPEYDHGN